MTTRKMQVVTTTAVVAAMVAAVMWYDEYSANRRGEVVETRPASSHEASSTTPSETRTAHLGVPGTDEVAGGESHVSTTVRQREPRTVATTRGDGYEYADERSGSERRIDSRGQEQGAERETDRAPHRGDRPSEPDATASSISGAARTSNDRAESRLSMRESQAIQTLPQSEVARTRPIRPEPRLVRLDENFVRVIAPGAVSYEAGGRISRVIGAPWFVPVCFCECRPTYCDGSQNVLIEYADGEKVSIPQAVPR